MPATRDVNVYKLGAHLKSWRIFQTDYCAPLPRWRECVAGGLLHFTPGSARACDVKSHALSESHRLEA